MKTLEIYLAGACKYENDEGLSWREELKNNWEDQDLGIHLINPLDYFRYSENWHQNEKQVKQYYFSRIRKSDVLLVNLNNSDSSCGTCQEVQYAIDHEIPVIGFGHENVYNWLTIDCQCIFDSAEEAMEYIVTYYS